MLSIISPVFRAENILDQLVSRIKQALPYQKVEIILVDDYSPDNSWEKIEELAAKHPEIRGIKLSRNFGQHYAITAGLDAAKGEWIIVMDCDLQDRPEEISKLLAKAQEGFDVVLARRVDRQDRFFKRLSSKVFYRSLAWLTGTDQDESIANFGIYHRRVINEITGMRERIRYFPTMVKWVGFRQTSIEVVHAGRAEGSSNYNFRKLFNLALDIMLAYSDKPIRLTVKLGFGVALTGFLFALYTLFKYLKGDIIVAGYASLIISIWVLTGFLLITLGMIGLYIGKTFEGVKQRPIYIVEKEI
ncbi:glycosyltransferase family 2 protein [Algoriphagus halophytocola]|uniref:Glycosyltransferase family 2 protein n=1 Tax=Algoriphagus halophytocola TaxID=2991499 RepID=A0ABY6MJJ2_9BACT|nr:MULTISPECIES: glycosyltransferase family 2 protein [unclassified Algoriphagus]UZD23952.1 glycosyltransferase family 2 protein [Algoriphagus sp. TR-M5]WBL41323.1 glycosyltransferase family 2 protein [Algoriphagus sp. TR-M9]